METLAVDSNFLQQLLNRISATVFVVDNDGRLHFVNRRMEGFLQRTLDRIRLMRGGDVFHCVHRNDVPEGCGHGQYCKKECQIKAAVTKALNGEKIDRNKIQISINPGGIDQTMHMLVSASTIEYDGNVYAMVTMEDLNELIRLQSLLPICASCKKIRNDENYWESVELYIKTRIDVEFTHSICPEYMEKHYGVLNL